jgi:DNA-binding transcriptional ArsR family regulator
MPRLDRNARARLMVHAEALDRRTRLPGQHGGVLKRTGLAVLKALLFGFANVATGRCDPSFDTLARAAGVARSTVAVALGRLEAAGLLERVRRQIGRVRYSNAYRFPAAETLPGPRVSPKSDFRAQTTTNLKTNSYEEPRPLCRASMMAQLDRVRTALRGDIEAIRRNREARDAAARA